MRRPIFLASAGFFSRRFASLFRCGTLNYASGIEANFCRRKTSRRRSGSTTIRRGTIFCRIAGLYRLFRGATANLGICVSALRGFVAGEARMSSSGASDLCARQGCSSRRARASDPSKAMSSASSTTTARSPTILRRSAFFRLSSISRNLKLLYHLV